MKTILGKTPKLEAAALLLCGLFPFFFLYAQNADVASFREIALPALLCFLSCAALAGLLFFIAKDIGKAALASIIFFLVCSNYIYMEKISNWLGLPLRYWQLAPLALVAAAHVAWFVFKKLSGEAAGNILKIISVAFATLIVINFVAAVPHIYQKTVLSLEKKTETQVNPTSASGYMPNFYYLLFDEYASLAQMQKYYDYDNTEFARQLEALGFNVSYSSSNDYPSTSHVMANILNLDYVVKDNDPETLKDSYRKNSVLFDLLMENGYNVMGLSSADYYDLSEDQPLASSKTVEGNTIIDMIFSQTILYPFYEKNYSQDIEKEILNFEYLKSNSFPASNTFVISHSNITHVPFLFDDNGNMLDGAFQNEWNDRRYYLGNYIYATKLMYYLAESIVTRDPGAVIILCSDHGARGWEASTKINNIFEYEDRLRIFNAVYFGGKAFDIEGMSGVNTIRHVLNKLLKLNYEDIDTPVYNDPFM